MAINVLQDITERCLRTVVGSHIRQAKGMNGKTVGNVPRHYFFSVATGCRKLLSVADFFHNTLQ